MPKVHLSCIKMQGGPHSFSLVLPSAQPPRSLKPEARAEALKTASRTNFHAGVIYEVDEADVDYLLNYTVECEDNTRRHAFERPRPGAYAGGDGHADQNSAVVSRMVQMMRESGQFGEAELAELQSMIPQTTSERRLTAEHLVTCGTCAERVRVAPGTRECPNCGGSLAGGSLPDELDVPEAAGQLTAVDYGPALSDEGMKGFEDDLGDADELGEQNPECAECGYRPGHSGDPAKDLRKLQQHQRQAHGT